MIVAMYGPMAWIGTETYEGDRRPTDTERVNPTTRARLKTSDGFAPASSSTALVRLTSQGFAAITNVEDFMFGDYDAQVVCTANSQEQSKILFNKTKDLLQQLDPVTGASSTANT